MVRWRDERATWLLRAACKVGGVVNSVIKMRANVSNKCGAVMGAGKENAKRQTGEERIAKNKKMKSRKYCTYEGSYVENK